MKWKMGKFPSRPLGSPQQWRKRYRFCPSGWKLGPVSICTCKPFVGPTFQNSGAPFLVFPTCGKTIENPLVARVVSCSPISQKAGFGPLLRDTKPSNCCKQGMKPREFELEKLRECISVIGKIYLEGTFPCLWANPEFYQSLLEARIMTAKRLYPREEHD